MVRVVSPGSVMAESSVRAPKTAAPQKPPAARNWPAFRGVLAGLREFVPPAFPVSVRIGRVARGTLGTCRRERNRFVITIARDLDEEPAIEVLLHEWAHALSWSLSLDKLSRASDTTREAFEAASNDAAWGCAYARIWRVYSTLVTTKGFGEQG